MINIFQSKRLKNRSNGTVRELVSQYTSDDMVREAIIFCRAREIDFKFSQKRAVAVQEQYKSFSVQYFEHGKAVGYIPYHHKDVTYAESAAENWVKYVLDLSTVQQYSKPF